MTDLCKPCWWEGGGNIINVKADNPLNLFVLQRFELNLCCRELKDSTSDGGIDGNPPELLKAILSQEPATFQGSTYNTTDIE